MNNEPKSPLLPSALHGEEEWWKKYEAKLAGASSRLVHFNDIPSIIAESRRRAIEEVKRLIKNKYDYANEPENPLGVTPDYFVGMDEALEILSQLEGKKEE